VAAAPAVPPHRTAPGPLRLRRLELGLRQEDVAEAAGLNRVTVARLESGASAPSWATAAALAAALDADPAALFAATTSEARAEDPSFAKSAGLATGHVRD
jgi:transcriptional regulator with XRE-family HTH domain